MAPWRFSRSFCAPCWNFSRVARARLRKDSLLLLSASAESALKASESLAWLSWRRASFSAVALRSSANCVLEAGRVTVGAGKLGLGVGGLGEFLAEAGFEFGDAAVAAEEAFLERGGAGVADEPDDEAGDHGRDGDGEERFHEGESLTQDFLFCHGGTKEKAVRMGLLRCARLR